MSEVPKIIDLASLLAEYSTDMQLISYTSKYLTKIGDNYGSVMLALNLHIRNGSGEIEELSIVAKLPPITNPIYWQLFHPQRTCLTENSVYKYLGPAMKELQRNAGAIKEHIFDGFPAYFGSRISLNPEAKQVDHNAVLLLENLQISGYRAGKRTSMYDAAHARLVLQNLAQLHALPIALRLLRSKEFDTFIRPYTLRFDFNKQMDEKTLQQMNSELFNDFQLITNNNESAANRLKQMKIDYDNFLAQPDGPDKPFTTVGHFDLWINNLMIQYAEDGTTPQKVKFVDFQLAQLATVGHDIIFFLLSSVDITVLDQQFDELLELYYNAFVDCLKSVDVNVNDDYTFEAFMEEIRHAAPIEIPHALFMTKVILADNSEMPENYKDINVNVLTKKIDNSRMAQRMADILQFSKKQKFIE